MEFRNPDFEEAEMIVDEFWLPLAREMAEKDSYHELADDAREKALDKKREKLESKDKRFLVAEIDGKPAGYINYEVRSTPEIFARGDYLHVSELYVKKDFRRKGIASKLVGEAEEYAEEAGVERVELIVDDVNESAKRLYRERGYNSFRSFMKKNL